MYSNGQDLWYIPKKTELIREIACDLRRRLRVDDMSVPDIHDILLRLEKVFPDFKLKKLPVRKSFEAFATYEDCTMAISKVLLDALKHGSAAARWTIIHEVGHIALQHPNKNFKSRAGYRSKHSRKVPGVQKLFEREANIFAAEFLMPLHLVVFCKTAGEIRSRFQVGLNAAVYRFDETKEFRKENEWQEII